MAVATASYQEMTDDQQALTEMVHQFVESPAGFVATAPSFQVVGDATLGRW